MVCCKCKMEETNFVTPCRHRIHADCLDGTNYCCPQCQRSISIMDLFWDILRDAGMNRSEDFYKELSGCSDGLKGLIMLLINHDVRGWVFHQIYERSKLFPSIFGENPIYTTLIEESLLKNDLRLLKNSLREVPKTINENVLEILWQRDEMELLAETYDLNFLYFHLDRDPLMVAARTGNFALLHRMLAKKVNLNRRSSGTCAINLACRSESFPSADDQIKFIDLLLKHGATFPFPKECSSTESALMVAVHDNNVKLVEYLISKGAKPENFLMEDAIERSNLEMVKLLHKAGIRFKEPNRFSIKSSLSLACEKSSFDIVVFILNSGVDLKARVATIASNIFILVDHLINNNGLDILKLLLSYGATPCYNNLVNACKMGNFEIVKLLIDYGLDPREDGKFFNLLYLYNFKSIPKDDEGKLSEVVEFLLRIGGGDINVRNRSNVTALGCLCGNDENLPIVETLIRFGADIHLVESCKFGDPLLNACESQCPNIVRLLLRNGANVNLCNQFGTNCYLLAIRSENLETVKITLPLSHKNSVDSVGKGPFHYICRFRSKEAALKIFEYLTDEGVDMNILDKNGFHPLLNLSCIKNNIHPLLLEKYFENEDNLNFRISCGLEEILRYRSDEHSAIIIRKHKEEAQEKIKRRKLNNQATAES